jgi:hypothetical protein
LKADVIPPFHKPSDPLREPVPYTWSWRGISVGANTTVRRTFQLFPYRSMTVHVKDTQGATVNILGDPDGRFTDLFTFDTRSFASAFSYTWHIESKAVFLIVEVVQGGVGGTLSIYVEAV